MTRRRRLVVIDPSTAHPETQGVAEIVGGWDGDATVLEPALSAGDDPVDYEADGYVVLGSRASVYDDLPWLARLSAWLAPLVRGEVVRPVLGVCFGHQLVAHLAGARVGPAREDGTKIVGVATTNVAGSRLLPDGGGLRVVVSHRESVIGAPADWSIVARRPDCAIDGLEHPTLPVFAFQFHPEARDEFARSAGIPEDRIDATLRRDSSRVIEAFRRHVAEA